MTWHDDLVMKYRSVPKSVFKAQALQYFREVELSGEPLIITDRGILLDTHVWLVGFSKDEKLHGLVVPTIW